ncbi:MAG: DUF2933 domain-containing protein [Betaproteobacteria bacterium]|nr:DUF2933 domain-containing protein [Betaproteobacteria bacterium]
MNEHNQNGDAGFFRSKVNWVLCGFLAIAAFFLILEHKAHVLEYLPVLILLACPLLHFFMHRGHGGHGHGAGKSKEEGK